MDVQQPQKSWVRNVGPAQSTRAANVLARKVKAARELLEPLGYEVTAPDRVPAELAAATIEY